MRKEMVFTKEVLLELHNVLELEALQQNGRGMVTFVRAFPKEYKCKYTSSQDALGVFIDCIVFHTKRVGIYSCAFAIMGLSALPHPLDSSLWRLKVVIQL